MNLGGSFGEAAPSHAAEPVTSRPRTEDLFNPAAAAMDRLVPGLEARQRLLFVVPPQARHHHAGPAAPGPDRRGDVGTATGAVGKDIKAHPGLQHHRQGRH